MGRAVADSAVLTPLSRAALLNNRSWSTFLPTGKGTTVAILDSGINAQHSTFNKDEDGEYKLSLYSKSFVSNDCSDQLGHGTQCAGLLCGSPDNVKLHDTLEVVSFQGISPGAKVMVCKVVKDGTEIADIQAVCDAVDHILKYNRQCTESGCLDEKVNVISMSFGMTYFNHSLTSKIQEAVHDGIIVVCAASNEGKKTSLFSRKCISSCKSALPCNCMLSST